MHHTGLRLRGLSIRFVSENKEARDDHRRLAQNGPGPDHAGAPRAQLTSSPWRKREWTSNIWSLWRPSCLHAPRADQLPPIRPRLCKYAPPSESPCGAASPLRIKIYTFVVPSRPFKSTLLIKIQFFISARTTC
jgi:hypothetical protein